VNIKELLVKQASSFPQKPAIIFEEEKITFPQLRDFSFKLANHLLSLGVKRENRIAIFLPNILETIFSYLGTFSIGAGVVPLDFMLTEEEVINLINHSESKILITQPKRGVNLENIKNNCPTLEEIIVCKEKIGGFSFWGDFLENSPQLPEAKIEEGDLASILYTSGSTGHPKGVMLTYKHFDNPIKCIDYFLNLSDRDVALCGGVPFSHIGGLDYILLMLYFGVTLVVMERFSPGEFLKIIERHRVTIFWIVPAMYVAILSLKDYERFDLSSLRYAIVFGAPSSAVLLRRFHQLCPNAYLLNGWGMTETAAPNCILPSGTEKIESVGKFAPWVEAKIVNDKGDTLPQGEQGELWVRGDFIMSGYYKEPQLTGEVITEDGWLKTGDIAKFDKQGLLYIIGRKRDMIKVAGEIVFSPEVEEKIYRHPKVKEVAVIGVPDKLRGEVPKAFIVVKEGQNLDVEELQSFLREHLAHFKLPRYFEFLRELPKTRTGKPDKIKLKSDRVSSF
jgi:acyl-CoA synthetase (AMP-forming)/AMP-acid ligase II